MRLVQPDDFKGSLEIKGVKYQHKVINGFKVVDVPFEYINDSLWSFGFYRYVPQVTLTKEIKARSLKNAIINID